MIHCKMTNPQKKRLSTLPTVPTKLFFISNTRNETEEIDSLLKERSEFICRKRKQKCKDLMTGRLVSSNKLVELTKVSGKFFHYMGFEKDGIKHIYPEEALYLVETSNLEVFLENYPISLQQAYSLLITASLPIHKYQVYSQLCRQGYKVVRHQENLSSSNIKDTQRSALPVSNSWKKRCSIIDLTIDSDDNEEMNCVHGVRMKKKLRTSMDSDAHDFVPSSKYKHPKTYDEEKITILNTVPNIYGVSLLELGTPEQSLLPPNISLSKARYTFHSMSEKNVGPSHDELKLRNSVNCLLSRNEICQINKLKSQRPNIGTTKKRSQPSSHNPADSNSMNGSDLRNYLHSLLMSVNLLHSPSGTMPAALQDEKHKVVETIADVRRTNIGMSEPKQTKEPRIIFRDDGPLLSTVDWTSVGGILEKLQLFQRPELSSPIEPLVVIDYDIYSPDSTYSKRNPGLPKYRLIILRSGQSLPSWYQLAQIQAKHCDNVPILCAINTHGVITYFEYNNVF